MRSDNKNKDITKKLLNQLKILKILNKGYLNLRTEYLQLANVLFLKIRTKNNKIKYLMMEMKFHRKMHLLRRALYQIFQQLRQRKFCLLMLFQSINHQIFLISNQTNKSKSIE